MKKRFSKYTKLGGLWLKSFVKKDKRNYPLISVIMPNYKSTNLEKSIKSVLNQTYKNVEFILVDGDSGKKTIQILKKYNNKIDFWLSEKDNGMWDAWNKGFKLANGRFVGIVDSSNKLYPDAMKTLSKLGSKRHSRSPLKVTEGWQRQVIRNSQGSHLGPVVHPKWKVFLVLL